jgi:predicted ATPase
MTARVTRLRVEGLRTLESVDIDLDGLRVLIGENGSGKSTILEALEVLRLSATESDLANGLRLHGGIDRLLRYRTKELTLGCSVLAVPSDDGVEERSIEFEYSLTLDRSGIAREQALHAVGDERISLIERNRNQCAILIPAQGASPLGGRMMDGATNSVGTSLLSPHRGDAHPHIAILRDAIRQIRVHVPTDTLPSWVAARFGRPSGARSTMQADGAPSMDALGTNLANVIHGLVNGTPEAMRRRVIEVLRLGLGDWVEAPFARHAHGTVELWTKHDGLELQIPAGALSDGQLAFMALVAILDSSSGASIVAIDEPESHLHPKLQVLAAELIERLSESIPVLVATHSRRFLDALSDPVASVRICRSDGRPGKTELFSLDGDALAKWAKDYDGIGRMLDEGLEHFVVRDPGGNNS